MIASVSGSSSFAQRDFAGADIVAKGMEICVEMVDSSGTDGDVLMTLDWGKPSNLSAADFKSTAPPCLLL